MDTTELNTLKTTLKAGKVTIEFTKTNGVRRLMTATLDPSVIPPTSSTKVKDQKLLVVWDVHHNGWRTIRVDSIHKWEPGEVSDSLPVQAAPTSIGWTPITQVPSQQ